MPYDPQHHHRRSIRLHGYDYAQAGAYFVTICTHMRQHLFSNPHLRQIAEEQWVALDHAGSRGACGGRVTIDTFVVMPDHTHGIIIIHDGDGRTGDGRAGDGRAGRTGRAGAGRAGAGRAGRAGDGRDVDVRAQQQQHDPSGVTPNPQTAAAAPLRHATPPHASHPTPRRIRHPTPSHPTPRRIRHPTPSHPTPRRIRHPTPSHPTPRRIRHPTPSHPTPRRIRHPTPPHATHPPHAANPTMRWMVWAPMSYRDHSGRLYARTRRRLPDGSMAAWGDGALRCGNAVITNASFAMSRLSVQYDATSLITRAVGPRNTTTWTHCWRT